MRINKTDDISNTVEEKNMDVTGMDIDPSAEKSDAIKGNKDEEFDENDYSRPQATFQFKIENFSKLAKQALSPPCFIRNLPWKILGLVRTHERNAPPTKFLGYFLQCNAESESQTWSCQATATLRLLSQVKGCENYCKQISHLFYFKENDWGYNQFLTFKEIMDPAKGYYKDDSIILEVSVQADAPHGVSWDSKKHTGFVGLKNQGATCYMNSILQTLFFTNQLRKDVYQIPTEGDDAGKSVALALQRVFYELQTCDKPVGTKKVTKSFGWETLDSFMQHDVQEFCRVLLDKIESKMKGSLVEGRIPKLFEGKMISYIKCKNVDYCSQCTEAFYDIQLNVKGMNNIYESFKQYINPQTLDGDNKYDAGQHGLQEAEKGVKFERFPPVLHLQLMRYEYDPTLDTNVKINDKFEFPERLNLDEFLDKPESTPAHYILHAVLVHSGDNHGGHYVVYINPKADGKWCKFDDDVVSRCTKREAIDNNFGGVDEEINTRNTSNAYMLVYIRESAKDQVLDSVNESDIPDILVDRLKEEKRIEMIKRKEKNEAHLYFNIDIFLEDNFMGFIGHDLFDHVSHVKRTFKCRRDSYFKDFMADLANYMKFGVDQIRVWPLFKRSNGTIRFTNVDPACESKRLYEFVGGDIWTIYLETLPPDSNLTALPPFDNSAQVLLFLKFYDPRLKMIYYCGHAYADINKPMNQLAPLLRQKAGLPDTIPLLAYEEVSYSSTTQIADMNAPLNVVIAELMNGDIIVFQKASPDINTYELPTPIHFFEDMYHHVDMLFCDKNKMNDPGFKIAISMRSPYQDAMQTVANYLGTDKRLLQFFTTNPYRDTPQAAIKSSFSGHFQEIFQMSKTPTAHKIYYQRLSIPLDELEAKTLYKCVWVDSHYKEEHELVLYANKSATVGDLLHEAKTKILAQLGLSLSNSQHGPEVGAVNQPIAEGGGRDGTPTRESQVNSNSSETMTVDSNLGDIHIQNPDPTSLRLRMVDLNSLKYARILPNDLRLENLPERIVENQLRIEEVPSDEIDLKLDELLVPCTHFYRDAHNSFGIPFFIKVKNDELFESVKLRIQHKLDVPDKEFEKYRFFLISQGRSNDVSPSDYRISINDFRMAKDVWIGMEHLNKLSKHPRSNYMEKPIKIHN